MKMQRRNHWGVGGGRISPPNMLIDNSKLRTALYMGASLAQLHCNKVEYFKIYLSTTQLNDLKFKIPKILFYSSSPLPRLLFLLLLYIFNSYIVPTYLQQVC